MRVAGGSVTEKYKGEKRSKKGREDQVSSE